MKKNIFLTGAPSSGKTTVIKKIINKLDLEAKGFITEEVKKENRRVGFMMKTLDGKEGFLAHEDIDSDFHIRRYGVNIENINHIALPAIQPEKDFIIVLDEIGKMECFSESFKKAALDVLNSGNIVIGTITFGGDDFIKSIKTRDDIHIIEVTNDNRNSLPDTILKNIYALWDMYNL